MESISKPRLPSEELNRCAVVFANPPFFAKDNLFPQPIQSGLFVGAC
jgi:hypothetical protein